MADPPRPGRSRTSVACPVRPHTSALTLTPAGSSFPRHCAPALQALKSSCLLLLEKAQSSSCGWACSHVCVMDDNRPTPLRSRARTGRKGIWKTQRSRSSFYVCRVEELILRSTVFYNVVPLVTDLSGSLGPVHCIVQPPPPPKMCSIRTTEPTRTDESQRADRATGRTHSSQAGVKGSMPTYSNSLPRRHAQGKLVASCHTMGLSGLAPSTGHALQPMATFLVRTASR